MKRTLGAMCVGLGMAAGCAVDAVVDLDETSSEITYGQLDGEAHPAVVMILMDVGGVPSYRCSGTLLSPTVVLTAGHCTGEPGEFTGMRVFPESDLRTGALYSHPYVEAASWDTHPAYTSAAFFLHDVGVINLAEPIALAPGTYGVLPSVDSLDVLRPRNTTTFTAVGYGLQRVNPAQVVAEKVRMRSNPYLLQINTPGFTGPGSLLLSNNASTGGTCFGDSGGPNFVGNTNVIAGVTSFGLNGACGGTGGVFRVDRADVLGFIADASAN